MPRLRLDVETLDVQSFDTAGKEDERGTVLGASVETFQAWCTEAADCTSGCTAATQPAGACYSVPGEVCPQQPPTTTGTL